MPEKLDRCVKKVTKQQTDKFVKDNSRQPNKTEKSKIRQSAFAICNSQLGCLDGTLTGAILREVVK